jgi:hypothetical protein
MPFAPNPHGIVEKAVVSIRKRFTIKRELSLKSDLVCLA